MRFIASNTADFVNIKREGNILQDAMLYAMLSS